MVFELIKRKPFVKYYFLFKNILIYILCSHFHFPFLRHCIYFVSLRCSQLDDFFHESRLFLIVSFRPTNIRIYIKPTS